MIFRIAMLCVLSLCSFAAWACPGGTAASMKASDALYSGLPAVQDVNINSEFEVRNAALTAISHTYRLAHGLSTLPVGSQFQVTYSDGSSECAIVDSTTSSLGAVPVPDTQKAAPAGGGTGGGATGGGSGGGAGGGAGGGYTYTCYATDPDTGKKTEIPCNSPSAP